MDSRRRFRALILLAALLAVRFNLPPAGTSVVHAEDSSPGDPQRQTVLTVEVDQFQWWISDWDNNAVRCELVVGHPGPPTGEEVYRLCGGQVYEDWIETVPCNQDDRSQCPGVYMHLNGQARGQEQIAIELPPAEVTLSMDGCAGENLNQCNDLPNLVLAAFEPLPNEVIVRVQGRLGEQTFSCQGGDCRLPLFPTGQQGVALEFWADSSFGDSSLHYTGLVRVVPWGDFADPEGGGQDPTLYYVDVLSSQWRGPKPASCSETWKVFPELGGPPAWLTTPTSAEGLASDTAYYYLAGMLIRSGAVVAADCPGGGLQADGTTANECGMQAAQPQVEQWQNQFDAEILQVAQDTGVPGRLMKNIFSRESQFWPGIFQNYMEAGLGQMTEYGADTVLLWNESFYDQFCPLALSQGTCDKGFANLSAANQNLLRGALVQRVNADCPECQTGIDLSQAWFSVRVFAETLTANCGQAGQIVTDASGHVPGQVSSYVDLWKFTLVNYTAGAGCLSTAVQRTWGKGELLTWENVSAELDPVCQAAVEYVDEVAR
jgi:hypothetical protein